MIGFRAPLLSTLGLLLGSTAAWAADPEVHWPSGWQVEEVVPDDQAPAQPSAVSRQRAIKNDENGTTLMVMELTGTPIEAGHTVNLQGVLLEMRKSIQKDFAMALARRFWLLSSVTLPSHSCPPTLTVIIASWQLITVPSLVSHSLHN